jgi:hypothetical protein
MIFGAILIAFTIFFTDTHVNADPLDAYPTPVAAELDRIAKDIQTNLSGAVGIQNQLTDIRSKLPSFEEFAGNGGNMPPTPASEAPLQPAPVEIAQSLPTPTPQPTVEQPAQVAQVQQVVIEVIVTATFTPAPPPPPQPIYREPMAQTQTISYQPAQGGTTPATWQPFQIGHVRGGTYIYSRAALWMDCTQIYLTGGGQTAASYEGSQISATLSSQPPQEQIAYYHICDYALKQEGKR